MRRGLFISFEGSEGCGKSTQIARLDERLRAAREPSLLVREPGGTAVGEAVRRILLDHPAAGAPIAPETELFLFAASRAQLVREVIRPALDAGTHVIADRFVDSTTVYQGFGRGLDPDAVARLNALAIGDCLPGITFVLDMDAAAAHARAMHRSGGRPDRMESEPPEFFQRIRDGYRRLAETNPARIVVLDATGPVIELGDEIWRHVARRLDSR
jgi:dTMP kinase